MEVASAKLISYCRYMITASAYIGVLGTTRAFSHITQACGFNLRTQALSRLTDKRPLTPAMESLQP